MKKKKNLKQAFEYTLNSEGLSKQSSEKKTAAFLEMNQQRVIGRKGSVPQR